MIPPPNTEHALMDSEHRTVLDWAREGAKRLRETRPAQESLYAIDVLVHLARSHFEHEQVEMRERAYPDRVVHRQDHERLLAELAQLRQAIVEEAGGGGGTTRSRTHERLAVWMHAHIAGHDRRYAKWLLRQRGPNSPGCVKPTWGAHDSQL
jgi:hemerythrin-like metal-binding protein